MKSLASGEQDYVGVQIRKTDTCILHVQGEGKYANRGYGVAGNVKSGEALATWVASLDAPYSSLAGTSRSYAGAQVAIRGNSLHFQVIGPQFQGNGGRGYGAVLNIEISDFPALATFIESNIQAEEDDFEDETDNDEGCCEPQHKCCS